MAKKTVIGIFYNEEWMLPFWLKHHREIFDHGILINYRSTDRSVEIIKELCPSWEIRDTRNPDFTAGPVDSEIMDVERDVQGWCVALNIPEFIIGNYSYMDDDPNPKQILTAQYTFVDMERREEPYFLDHNRPLYEQRWWGFGGTEADWEKFKARSIGSPTRSPRSIHNHPISYETTGRHFWGREGTHSDLVIFYYANASLEEASIKRRMQIQTQVPGGNSSHNFTLDQLMDRFKKEHQPMSRDLRPEIKNIIEAHELYLAKKKLAETQVHSETNTHIQSAIDALQNALNLNKPK